MSPTPAFAAAAPHNWPCAGVRSLVLDLRRTAIAVARDDFAGSARRFQHYRMRAKGAAPALK